MQHTQGPWEYARLNKYTIISRIGNKVIPIADTMEWRQGDNTKHAEHTANAHLIAAAPEMLQLLKDSVQWLGKMIADKGHEQSVMPNHCVNTMMKIESLLAKLA